MYQPKTKQNGLEIEFGTGTQEEQHEILMTTKDQGTVHNVSGKTSLTE